MKLITEQEIENITLEMLSNLGYEIIYGPDIAPDSDNPLRKNWSDVILEKDLLRAVRKLNPQLSDSNVEEVIKRIRRLNSVNLIKNNERFHKLLVEGLPLEYRARNGRVITDNVKLVDFENPHNNIFKAVNQFSIIENNKHRRPDIIIFINGLPLAIFELKNPADENADLDSAYKQLKTYMQEIPKIFYYNELLVITDGTSAEVGTITSSREWFLPWKTIDGKEVASKLVPQIEVLLKGLFSPKVLLDVIHYFITFSKSRTKTAKILAGYHQYYAANKAIEKTLKALSKSKKAGIIWHTQGSGKSLTLAFYVGKIQVRKELKNPTFVILTDRNDLDDQLFQTFSQLGCLRENPKQARSKEELKRLLNRSSGGIIFTTIQKFDETFEVISERSNIIVAADEAHRTQYGFKAKINPKTGKITYGFAKYLRTALPNATFIGFTGTPIELEDRSTKSVFGNYIDIYDIEQSLEDGRTVRIYYESRVIPLELKKEQQDLLDQVDEITERDERQFSKLNKWLRLERVVGAKSRIKRLAEDIVNHFEKRLETLDGKGMVVCMSRRIAIELHNEIKKLRPEWYNKNDDKGFMKVIITGSAADGPEWQEHIRDKRRREKLANLFKDPNSEFKLAIVRDMWLTGFDVPVLHTMYIDKPMKGHTLMQAIARVNRVYKNKQGGLIVDYIGIAHDLKNALSTYTKSGGRGKPVFDQKEAISLLLEKYEIVSQMFFGFNYKQFFSSSTKEKMEIVMEAMEHILSLKDGKKRYLKAVTSLTKAYSLSVPSEEAEKLSKDIAFFQLIKASLVKNTEPTEERSNKKEDVDSVIKQIFSKAISSKGVIDVFKSANIKKPEISILSDSFLEEVKNIKQKNLAVEALKKVMCDQIKVIYKKNKVKRKKFSELLKKIIIEYHNRSVDSAQVIQELVNLANKIKKDKDKGKQLGLSPEEEAFYDALANNKSAVEILGEDTLKKMAFELTESIRKNVTIDWTIRPSVQAKLRVMVKHLLKRYGYPPDKRKMAVELVLDQAKLLADDFALSLPSN